MKFLGTLFVFFGYVFVYASTAAGGKFATEPWAGLFADAYTGTASAAAQAQVATQGPGFDTTHTTPAGYGLPR